MSNGFFARITLHHGNKNPQGTMLASEGDRDMSENEQQPMAKTPHSEESPALLDAKGHIGINRAMKRVLAVAMAFIALQLIFLLCNIAAVALPKEPILMHLAESQDSPLLSRVFDYGHEMLGSHVTYDNNRFIEALARQDTFGGDLLESTALNGIDYTMPDSNIHGNYYRYWHGWQLFAFLCLTFGTIDFLALVIAVFAMASSLLFLSELRHYVGWPAAIAFSITSLFATNIIGNFMGDLLLCLSITSLLFFCALILRFARTRRRCDLFATGALCLFAGAVFCYLDFFTIPAFAIALTVFSCLLASNILESGFGRGVRLLCLFTLLFLVGFVGTWITKWLLASIYLGWGFVLSDILSETTLWAVQSGEAASGALPLHAGTRLYAVAASFGRMLIKSLEFDLNWAGAICCLSSLLFAVIAVALILKGGGRVHFAGGLWALLGTSLFPPAFAFLAYSHTLFHLGIFGYKSWAFTLGCISCVAIMIIARSRSTENQPVSPSRVKQSR